ncbi:MAG: hypothetical protein ACOCVM_07440 [Desulfovibrionaceae bacterium]
MRRPRQPQAGGWLALLLAVLAAMLAPAASLGADPRFSWDKPAFLFNTTEQANASAKARDALPAPPASATGNATSRARAKATGPASEARDQEALTLESPRPARFHLFGRGLALGMSVEEVLGELEQVSGLVGTSPAPGASGVNGSRRGRFRLEAFREERIRGGSLTAEAVFLFRDDALEAAQIRRDVDEDAGPGRAAVAERLQTELEAELLARRGPPDHDSVFLQARQRMWIAQDMRIWLMTRLAPGSVETILAWESLDAGQAGDLRPDGS